MKDNSYYLCISPGAIGIMAAIALGTFLGIKYKKVTQQPTEHGICSCKDNLEQNLKYLFKKDATQGAIKKNKAIPIQHGSKEYQDAWKNKTLQYSATGLYIIESEMIETKRINFENVLENGNLTEKISFRGVPEGYEHPGVRNLTFKISDLHLPHEEFKKNITLID